VRLEFVPVIVLLATSAAAQTPQRGPEPMGKIELVALLSYGSGSGLPKQVEERGINFEVDQSYLHVLAEAGAGDDLVSALKAAKPGTVAPVRADKAAEIAARETSVLQHLVRANELNPNGIHYREAEPEFRAAVQADPSNPFSHFTLGSVLSRLGRHDDAAAEFREVLKLRPDWAEAHLSLAQELQDEKKLDEAILEIREAMRLEPDKAEPHFDLATAFGMRGDKKGAAEQRRIATALTPSVRLGARVEAAKLVYRPPLQYPAEAQKRHVEGTVWLTIIVGKDGAVKDWEVESGDPLLVPAAVDSVRQWRYQPCKIDNVPVEVPSEVKIVFAPSH